MLKYNWKLHCIVLTFQYTLLKVKAHVAVRLDPLSRSHTTKHPSHGGTVDLHYVPASWRWYRPACWRRLRTSAEAAASRLKRRWTRLEIALLDSSRYKWTDGPRPTKAKCTPAPAFPVGLDSGTWMAGGGWEKRRGTRAGQWYLVGGVVGRGE